MEGKKNGRLTVKMLSDEVEKEFKHLKETVKILEGKVNNANLKVKELEEKLARISDKSKDNQIKCNVCETEFSSRKNLRKHIKESHQTQINCNSCKESFTNNSDLENHLEEVHTDSPKFKCDHCGKKFILQWRLRKHLAIHFDEKTKKCHYFNNEKTCPFEKIGCMFLHMQSEICFFGKRCINKLCQYKHKSETNACHASVEENVQVEKSPKKSDNENTDDQDDDTDSVDTDIEDDENKIIFQRFLENKERQNKNKEKVNEAMKQFTFVSTKRPNVHV